jgi:hypothetical protein
MSSSCFFCQNLLSDYLEGILPAARHEQIKSHLDTCAECAGVHTHLVSTIKLLHTLPERPVSHEMALRITEAAESRRHVFRSSGRLSKVALGLSIPVLLFFGMVVSFPTLFPWVPFLSHSEDEAQYARYFPLLQGASDILDEQGNWLHSREGLTGSLWEEGGMSPEDFEKTFQIKGVGGHD